VGKNLGGDRDQSAEKHTTASPYLWRKYVYLSATLAVGSLLGCAGPKSNPAQWSNTPIVNGKKTTLVVEGASREQIESLLVDHPEAQAREVYSKAGMYEVAGIPEGTFRKKLSGLHIFANARKRLQITDMSTSDQIRVAAPRPSNLANPTFSANSCRRGTSAPRISLTPVTFRAELESRGVISKGAGDLVLSSTGTVSPINSRLEYLWVISGPAASAYESLEAGGDRLNLTPDQTGGYEVILLARDERGICAGIRLDFGVTENVAYSGPQTLTIRTPQDDQTFFHLGLVKAQEAWSITRGEGVTVAVIDSGSNYNHPDLANTVAVNSGEIAGNGIDDDNNGFVDDVLGYDFANGDSVPWDDAGHGSHVAGLVAGAVSGVAPGAKILTIKAMDAMGTGDLASIKAAILYAAASGAKIVNMSLGGYQQPSADHEEKLAIDAAQLRGVLIVAAAGNGKPVQISDGGGIRVERRGVDTDVDPNLPSAFDNANILAVAAVEETRSLSPFSNFGLLTVDLAAPGGCNEPANRPARLPRYCSGQGLKIPSVQHRTDLGRYVAFPGTSMATPIAAGVAALLKAQNPNRSYAEIKRLLMESVDRVPALAGRMVSPGVVNAKRALELGSASAVVPGTLAER
jgi:subtilisin family serine protease